MSRIFLSSDDVIQSPEYVKGLVRFVDARHHPIDLDGGRHAFGVSRLPGAVFADCLTVLSGPSEPKGAQHPLPPIEAFTEWVRDNDLDRPGVMVVCYDELGGAMAAGRAWWMLTALGLGKVRILAGGIGEWRGPREYGTPMQSVPEGIYASTNIRSTSRNVKRFADEVRRDDRRGIRSLATSWSTAHLPLTDFDGVMRRGQTILLDTRPTHRFHAASHKVYEPEAASGHVPGAVPFVFTDVSRSKLQAVEQQRREMNTDVMVMCYAGVTSAYVVARFVHEGLAAPKLYVGSWSEAQHRVPVVVPLSAKNIVTSSGGFKAAAPTSSFSTQYAKRVKNMRSKL